MHRVVAATPTQYAFAICLLIVTPVLMIFAASVQRRRGENPWKGALIVGAASWAAWIVSGVIAAALFPRYPLEGGPPEPVAMLFVLPGLLTGGTVLRWLVTRQTAVRPSSASHRLGLAATAVVAAACAYGLVQGHTRLTTWPARRELPESAEALEERALVDDFLGDFDYRLRARMTDGEFREWMRRLEVAPTDDPYRYGAPLDQRLGKCGERGEYSDGVGTFHAWCS